MLDLREERELDSLRARAWGPGGAATRDDVERLTFLEKKRVQVANAVGPETRSDEITPTPTQPVASAPPSSRAARLGWRTVAVIGAACAVLLATGVALGGAWAGAARQRTIPEFGWVQTNEDRIAVYEEESDPNIGLEPSSIRLIASLDEAVLYIGHRSGTTDVCVAAIFASVGGTALVSCGEGGVTSQLRNDLWVTVGPEDVDVGGPIPAGLEPRRLSTSVTIYTTP